MQIQNTNTTESSTSADISDADTAALPVNESDHTDTSDQTPWYKSQVISSMALSLMVMLWMTTGSFMLGQLEIKPTRVILKKEGCTYMHHQQLATQPYDDSSGMCIATAPFRSNLIGNGGIFKLQDQIIKVAENQIVAIENLDNAPFTDSQKQMILGLSISTALLLAGIAWAIFCLL
jgi:hypothetical protein